MGEIRDYFEEWIVYFRHRIFKFLHDREKAKDYKIKFKEQYPTPTARYEQEKQFKAKRKLAFEEYCNHLNVKVEVKDRYSYCLTYDEWRKRMDKSYREQESFEERKLRVEANKLSKDVWPDSEKDNIK